MSETKIPAICALCGPGPGCGIDCYVEDGRLVRVEGMEEAPLNKGTLSAKAYGSAQWLYSPQRLTHPLRRIGKKGEGEFERISWDEALDTVAARLAEQKEEYGARSLAVLSPQARSCKEYVLRFLHDHGCPTPVTAASASSSARSAWPTRSGASTSTRPPISSTQT